LAAFASLLLGPGFGHLLRLPWWRGAIWFFGAKALLVLSSVAAMSSALGVRTVATVWIVVRLAAAVDAALSRGSAEGLASWRKVLTHLLALALVAAGLHQLERAFVVASYSFPSGSMVPTLLPGDRILVRKLGPAATRGDLVVFSHPDNPSLRLLKRVVAVEGDTVTVRKGLLELDGRAVWKGPLDTSCTYRSYDDQGATVEQRCQAFRETVDDRSYRVIHDAPRPPGAETDPIVGPLKVPSGQLYLLGDNRDNSADSRMWGPIRREQLVGIVEGVSWSSSTDGIRYSRILKPMRELEQ
jgi:signal peptidase I